MPDVRQGLVLDTHVWIWLLNGDPLSEEAIAAITDGARQGSILVSAISTWEVGMLTAKGRISLTMPVLKWVQQGLEAPGLTLAAITPEIAIESCHLPGEIHGDPADRLIVATARMTQSRLVTKDQKLLAYGRTGHVEVVEA